MSSSEDLGLSLRKKNHKPPKFLEMLLESLPVSITVRPSRQS